METTSKGFSVSLPPWNTCKYVVDAVLSVECFGHWYWRNLLQMIIVKISSLFSCPFLFCILMAIGHVGLVLIFLSYIDYCSLIIYPFGFFAASVFSGSACNKFWINVTSHSLNSFEVFCSLPWLWCFKSLYLSAWINYLFFLVYCWVLTKIIWKGGRKFTEGSFWPTYLTTKKTLSCDCYFLC